MKKHLFSRIVAAGAVVVLMGAGANAFSADNSPFGGKEPQSMASPRLTDDQVKKMDAERNAFQTATKDLRDQIADKRQALNTELSKTTPDAAAAVALQKSISDLQAQFDQKRLAHILAMKKIDPGFTEGPGMKRGMGQGMGHGMPGIPGMPGMPAGSAQTPPVAKPAN